MQFNVLFYLSILSFLCFAFGQGSYDDCCLKYLKNMEKHIQKNAVKYKYQKTDGGCNIPAVIFTMRKGRKYCTNPRENWVKELMNKVDEREIQVSSMTKYKKPRRRPYKG
ncbi:C-C motif chemokine 20 [Nematolebias whitei]|uniref:C-C motif chemokine 20 n=1 Tax=Nematolebias whitei TaxID=451745 RepID=UPI00189C2E13|nr:C-C motif chemokine 20 [Nematolebias whitei]